MSYVESISKQFSTYKTMAEKAMAQVPDEGLTWQYNEESNSIAIIVKHLWGNMLSRWTDSVTSDGEKDWRDRDAEFVNDIRTREELLTKWNEGWTCLFTALNGLKDSDLDRVITIRGEKHSVAEALHRQLAHYASHVGQIVYVSKMLSGERWNSLSIPRGQSRQFNAAKFGTSAKP